MLTNVIIFISEVKCKCSVVCTAATLKTYYCAPEMDIKLLKIKKQA